MHLISAADRHRPRSIEKCIEIETTLPNQAALNAKLREVGAVAADDQPELHIRPNKLVDYNAVAAVMAAAQRSGVVKMGIVGSEQFLN